MECPTAPGHPLPAALPQKPLSDSRTPGKPTGDSSPASGTPHHAPTWQSAARQAGRASSSTSYCAHPPTPTKTPEQAVQQPQTEAATDTKTPQTIVFSSSKLARSAQ